MDNELSDGSDESEDYMINEQARNGDTNKIFGEKHSTSFSAVKNSVIFPL